MSTVAESSPVRWRKHAATSLVCVLLAAVGLSIGVQLVADAAQRRDALEEEWTRLKTQYENKYRKTQQFDELNDQLSRIERTLAPALRSVGYKDDQLGDFDRVQQSAATHRLEILSYQPSTTPRRVAEFFTVDHFDLQIAGRYRDLADFGVALANEGQLVALESLSLSRRGDGVLARMRLGHYTMLDPEEEATVPEIAP